VGADPDRVVEQLGKRIAELRAAAGLSQGDLARKLRTTPQWVSQLERGTRSPTVHTLVKIANGLGVPLPALFDAPDAPVAARGVRKRTPAK
jgi:transcriptional regulator with XRE-family HTH domain